MRSAIEWRRFLSRALALLGSGLALAGVVCFFAFNWSRIGRFGKLGLIAALITAAALVGWRRRDLAGQLALTAAAVLVGPLLGVYGQTYQTGADPYGLFLTWALLITPWVVAARFAPLWVIAIAVLDVGAWLWWSQAGAPGSGGEIHGWVTVGLLHAAALAAWEWQRRRSVPWFDETWAPRAVAAAGFGALFVPAASFVVDPGRAGAGISMPGLVGFLALVAAVAASYGWYRRARPDLFMLTLAGAAAMGLATVVVGRLLLDVLDLEELGLLLMALLVIAEIALGVRWLRNVIAADTPATPATPDTPDTLPWYVRVVAGFGAWIATLLFVGFLVVAGLRPDEPAALVLGGVLVAGAVLLRRRAASEFARQLALAASFTGQLLLVFRVGDVASSVTVGALCALALSVALIILMPDAAHRFMSAVVGSVAAFVAVAEQRVAWGVSPLRAEATGPGFDLFVQGSELAVLALVAAAAWVWRAELGRRAHALTTLLEPVGYGLVVALLGILLVDALVGPALAFDGPGGDAHRWQLGAVTTAGITVALCLLARAVVREHGAGGSGKALVAAIGGAIVLAALTLPTPGIVATVAVLVLGFDRRRTVLVGLATVFLLVFATFYYYSLRISLLGKAGVLVASGVLLLAAAAYVARRFTDTTPELEVAR